MSYENKAIIIIAAARSGTKMLRYILSASDQVCGYPYDANYIWKYGNYSVRHDEIVPSSIDKKTKQRIRKCFLQVCNKEGKPYFLEKSVSNSLRVPFVRSVFPDCKIIHLYRDGFDVLASSRMCWQASARSELIQTKEDRKKKIKEFPLKMAWPYMLNYLKVYGKKSIFRQQYVSSWGPRYKGIDKDIQKKSLTEVCAIQWKRCVDHCCDELSKLKKDKEYINISYEKLVVEPEIYIERLIEFIGASDGQKIIERGVRTTNADFIGSRRNNLSEDELKITSNIIATTQKRIQNLT